MRRWHLMVAVFGIVLGVGAAAQHGSEQHNMELVGYNDLQARSAYQPIIHQQGERWIAYIGHHGGTQVNPLTGNEERNGTSIVDVTDPRQPRYLTHIPSGDGQGEGSAQMTQVCNGSELPRGDDSRVYLLRTRGNAGHEIWDVTVPETPSRLTVIVTGLAGTHKSWWECDTGIGYLVSGDPEWRTNRMTKIYDLSDPTQPVFIRDFGLPGQQPGTTGPVPTSLHGPISLGPSGNRVYFGYGTSQAGVMQIVDREKLLNGPKEPTEANLVYPEVVRVDLPLDVGGHTAFPLLGLHIEELAKQQVTPAQMAMSEDHDHGEMVAFERGQAHRDFVAVVSESTTSACMEPRQMVRMIDVTFETQPIGVSTWTVPEASGNFCDRGGRFGAHASHENFTPIYYGRVMFVSFFNAGVRALDVRDPFNPREIAYYIPATTANTAEHCVGEGPEERCSVVIQTNNVEVDDRGYIYAVDRANTGMHILQLTGAARSVANFPGN